MLILAKVFVLGTINSINKEVELYFLCEILDYEDEKFWTKINRKSSELSAEIGKQKFIKVANK